MASAPNRIFSLGAGVPGLRLNERRGHLVIDASATVDGHKVSTSYLCSTAVPLAAVARAVAFRERALQTGE